MKRILFLVMLLALAIPAAPRLGYLTLGPMVHFNFGENEFKAFSFGLEGAYWNYARGPSDGFLDNVPDFETPGWGAALGFEVDGKALRFHLEPQIGWVYAGVSLGSVLEISRQDGSILPGFQGSGWVNALLGFDLRYRRIGGRNVQALGLYGKLGRLVSGRETTPD